MKLIDLIQVKGAFDTKAEIINKQVGFKIIKLIKAIEVEMEYYQSTMQDIINKYANVDNAGNVIYDEKGIYTIPKENVENYKKEIEELESVEVTKPDITFTIEELENVKLQLGGLYILYPFITE